MKKGFTLTLSMVIVLIFMTSILTIETQKVSIEEETHSQHAKLRAINSILLDLNSSAFDYSISRMGKRAMFNVINEQIASRIKDGPTYGYVEDAPKAICEEFTDNFAQYLSLSLGTRLNDTGLSIEYENMDCNVELINATHVNLTTSADLTFIEENKIEIKKSISLNSNFSIEGLPDPMLAIESFNDKDNILGPIIRPILLSPLYNDTENWKDGNLIIEDDSLLYAKGWVYGKVVDYESDDTDDVKYQKEVRGNILLIGPSINTKILLQNAIDFAESNGSRAVAIDSSVSLKSEEIKNKIIGACTLNYTLTTLTEKQPCISCGTFAVITNVKSTCGTPSCITFGSTYGTCEAKSGTFYFYNPSGDDTSYSGVYAAGNYFSNGDYVLIDGQEEEGIPLLNRAKVYNIERQRSATLCGNYFLNDNAPNIFSRMEGKLNEKDEYGIETFLLGTWVLEDENSKLDYQYYDDEEGVYVKGMLGCKDADMCESEFPNIGRFAIDKNELEKYGMEDIKYE